MRLSESMFDGGDDDLLMDWDSDGHESDSEHMHDGSFFLHARIAKNRASKNLVDPEPIPAASSPG